MRLFLGNLPFTVESAPGSGEMVPMTREFLYAWIEKWGITVLSATLVTPDAGPLYGFANVPKEQGSTAIRLLDGKILGGNKITVRLAQGK